MKKVSAAAYVKEVYAIYNEKPKYEIGHDGSDGKCDCIGMVRGALKRAGATDVTNMRGTNQAARESIRNLSVIEYVSALRIGDVVLKTRPKDDAEMPLPDKYRKGGNEYDPNVGETNFTHIGTITSKSPLEITHMTSPTAKKDISIKGWSYFGKLPWVDDDPEPSPEPTPEPPPEPITATVVAEHGKTVKMRAKPSTKCSLYWDVPILSTVLVNEIGKEWSNITYTGQTGWMMTKFLAFVGCLFTVHVPNLSEVQAQALLSEYPGSWMDRE